MTYFDNATNWTSYLEAANTMTDGLLVYSLMVVVFLVLFMSTLVFGKWRALTYSSFVSIVLGAFLNTAGLLDYWVLVLNGIFLVVGVFMMMQSKRTVGD